MVGMTIALLVTLILVYSRSRNVLPILGGHGRGRRHRRDRRAPGADDADAGAGRRDATRWSVLAAVFIAVAAVNNPAAMGLDVPITFGHKLELFIGTFIGAITFSGSVIAFGKLSGRIRRRAGSRSAASISSTSRSASR